MLNIIAIDLGASNGRVIVGKLNDNKILELDVVYRFENYGVKVNDSLYWDILRIFTKIKKGLSLIAKKYGSNKISSIGLNSWGVDYVLLNSSNDLIGLPFHYRDKRTDNIMEEMFKKVPKEEIFNQTGIQFMQLNTSTQLYSMVYNKSPQLSIAKTFLMIPDYFNYLLSGKKSSEYSIATTSQLFDPQKNAWAQDLIEKLGLKIDWFCDVVQPGTILGDIQEDIAEDVKLNKDIKIIAPLCHDTGSAVAAVPVDMNRYQPGEWAYLSSGTWSLMGIEFHEPLINDKALKYNFANEGGIKGTIRFLKNITGLWLIQECKNIWNKEGQNLSWDNITDQAKNAPAFQHFIDPSDPSFINPSNMINAIMDFCKNHDQNPPKGVGQISRTIFESLAFKYKEVITNLEEITNTHIKILYIISGGSKNDLLNQFTANALNLPVKAGPSEATAIGNILVQALALNKIKDLKELRQIVKNSFQIEDLAPIDAEKWNDAYKSYLEKTK